MNISPTDYYYIYYYFLLNKNTKHHDDDKNGLLSVSIQFKLVSIAVNIKRIAAIAT